jgi:membrane associated rhomboid family serine protease
MATLALQGTPLPEEQIQRYLSLERYKRETREGAILNIIFGAASLLLHILLLAFNAINFSELFRSLLFLIGVMGVGLGVWQIRQARSLTVEDLRKHNEAKEFAKSIGKTKLTYTKTIWACLILVAVFQLITGGNESIQAAGLVKSAVWKGEVWRLLTCATLHANFIHICMNSQALIGLGKLIEAVTNRAYLTIVFLISALSGSIFSLVLMPNTTSVGASGGLMGLVGFLAVLGYRRKEVLPAGFFKSIVVNICFIGALGLVGFSVIDNAAHLGGLLAGAACGAVSISKACDRDSVVRSKVIDRIGIVSLIMIVLISLLSIVIIRK